MTQQNPQWYWNEAPNPFNESQPPQWTRYSENDNKIIEEAFQSKTPKAELQNHYIYFKERMQVNKKDHHKQRPIKRDPWP